MSTEQQKCLLMLYQKQGGWLLCHRFCAVGPYHRLVELGFAEIKTHNIDEVKHRWWGWLLWKIVVKGNTTWAFTITTQGMRLAESLIRSGCAS